MTYCSGLKFFLQNKSFLQNIIYFCIVIFERKIFEQEGVIKLEQAKQGNRVSMVCD